MKEIESPAIVRNQQAAIQQLFQHYVVPSYGRFDLALSHGQGSWVWDVNGKRYLDLGGGIAVNALGHAHPEIADALSAQARKLCHISNLYYHEHQGRLAQQIVKHLAPGKVFFCNSGAEANEGLYKLARKFGHDAGRFEIITAVNSFHGRTLAGISATGQDKVKKGFEPMVPGFRHVPFNDLAAVREAITPATVAVLIEGVQGEGGVTPATPEFLLGLRALCDERRMLLLMDGVQCGHFRTGKFQSYQRILENSELETRNSEHATRNTQQFLPDGLSMAKSLGNGFPIGAFWIREPHADLLGAGTHGTTYGGNLLGCAVALKVFEIIEREGLADNARKLGGFFRDGITMLAQKYPGVIQGPRGLGLMIGIELAGKEHIKPFASSDKAAATLFVGLLHEAGLLTIPAGTQIVRLLPALNLTRVEAEEGLKIIEAVVEKLA